MFYDLDNVPKPDQNELDRENTCSILEAFVRNLKTDDSNIKNKENIIEVPIANDSADIIIIIMMIITAKESKTNATICAISGDNIFPRAIKYISLDKQYNKNVSIINPLTYK